MKRADRIIELLDNALQSTGEASYGQALADGRCFRCEHNQVAEDSDLCAGCREFLLEDSAVDPKEAPLPSSPLETLSLIGPRRAPAPRWPALRRPPALNVGELSARIPRLAWNSGPHEPARVVGNYVECYGVERFGSLRAHPLVRHDQLCWDAVVEDSSMMIRVTVTCACGEGLYRLVAVEVFADQVSHVAKELVRTHAEAGGNPRWPPAGDVIEGELSELWAQTHRHALRLREETAVRIKPVVYVTVDALWFAHEDRLARGGSSRTGGALPHEVLRQWVDADQVVVVPSGHELRVTVVWWGDSSGAMGPAHSFRAVTWRGTGSPAWMSGR